MNSDDESLIGAYLDGELAPAQRREVESSLATDTRLAETLHDLANVRDLIGNLSRPTSPDVTPEVMHRIRQASVRPRSWTLSRRAGRWAMVGLAASAIGAVALVVSLSARRHGIADDHLSESLASSRTTSGGNATHPELNADLVAKVEHSDALPANVFGREEAASVLSTPRAGQLILSDQERVRKLLDDPHLRRVFLVADHLGEPAEPQVASLVERTTHRDYFKITVSQGIVIDPRHPHKATVFAVVLDQNELEPFRARLQKTFSDRLQEDDVSAAVAMQLTDIGQVVKYPANPVGDLTIPKEELALRVDVPPGDARKPEPALVAASDEVKEPTAEQERSSPAASLHRSGSILQKVEGAAANLIARTEKMAGDLGHEPRANNDDRPDHAGRPGARPVAAGAPQRDDAGRNGGLPSAERHLVVLVWITGTSSG